MVVCHGEWKAVPKVILPGATLSRLDANDESHKQQRITSPHHIDTNFIPTFETGMQQYMNEEEETRTCINRLLARKVRCVLAEVQLEHQRTHGSVLRGDWRLLQRAQMRKVAREQYHDDDGNNDERERNYLRASTRLQEDYEEERQKVLYLPVAFGAHSTTWNATWCALLRDISCYILSHHEALLNHLVISTLKKTAASDIIDEGNKRDSSSPPSLPSPSPSATETLTSPPRLRERKGEEKVGEERSATTRVLLHILINSLKYILECHDEEFLARADTRQVWAGFRGFLRDSMVQWEKRGGRKQHAVVAAPSCGDDMQQGMMTKTKKNQISSSGYAVMIKEIETAIQKTSQRALGPSFSSFPPSYDHAVHLRVSSSSSTKQQEQNDGRGIRRRENKEPDGEEAGRKIITDNEEEELRRHHHRPLFLHSVQINLVE